MIKAHEALEMVKVLRKQDEEALNEKVTKFCDDVCTKAIRNAINHRQVACGVGVPNDMIFYISRIIAALTANGFKVQVSDNFDTIISIRWDE